LAGGDGGVDRIVGALGCIAGAAVVLDMVEGEPVFEVGIVAGFDTGADMGDALGSAGIRVGTGIEVSGRVLGQFFVGKAVVGEVLPRLGWLVGPFPGTGPLGG
jgi:hypothetical protein